MRSNNIRRLGPGGQSRSAAFRCLKETRRPLQSKALLSQLNLPVLQASPSRRALIFATGQTYSSLKRLVALKAQIQKHARTPDAIGATTGDTKFQTLAPALASRLPRISSLAYWTSQTTRF